MDSTQNELIGHYLRKAQDKARVAATLLKGGEWEDAVSRAYYAAFHAAQAALLTEGQHPHSHQGLLTLFSLLLVKTGKFEKKWGRLLANLKDDREAGDYEVFAWIDEETAQRAVREAEEFVSEVQRYLEAVGIDIA